MTDKFCYWTVADKEHAKMAATLIKSAREVGVKEDFHIWTDLSKVEGATTVNACGNFDKDKAGCWFKLEFLLHSVSMLNYDYFVWLDADHYFTKKPRSLMEPTDKGLVMIPMENEITSIDNKRGDWWGVPTDKTVKLFQECGCKNRRIYNTNGGLFIVKKDFIKTFYHICYDLFNMIKKKGWVVPEEYCLAIMGNLFNKDLTLTNMRELQDIWACDWTGQFTKTVPEGKPWIMENYLTGVREQVNPAIVHCMRGKDGLVQKYKEKK